MNVRILNRMPESDFSEQVLWCTQCLGPGREVYSVTAAELHRWSYESVGFGIRVFYFRDDADYMLYLLRWA